MSADLNVILLIICMRWQMHHIHNEWYKIMINYNEMVKNESMEDVILFLVVRRESGLIYPAIDRFFYLHNGPDKYEACNIMILRETHRLLNEEKIMCGGDKGGHYMKGPKWIEPDFMSEGKYEID